MNGSAPDTVDMRAGVRNGRAGWLTVPSSWNRAGNGKPPATATPILRTFIAVGFLAAPPTFLPAT